MVVPLPSLEYHPLQEDLTPFLNAGNQYPVRRTAFLAQTEEGYFYVHGNSLVLVKQHGKNMSFRFITWRWWRVWDIPRHMGFNAAKLALTWDDDNKSRIPNWKDAPGQKFMTRPTTEVRTLKEFVVGIEGVPEAGFLYYWVFLTATASSYRVQMSGSTPYTMADWDRFQTTTGPIGTETRPSVVIDSGSQPWGG